MTEENISPPILDGFFMPAEWEPHACCWMQWPARGDLWGDRLPQVYQAYAQVARAISQFEPVRMIVRPEQMAEARFACGAGIDLVECEIDDSWARDSGPVFLVNDAGAVAGVNWDFNAWGNTYKGYEHDRVLAGRLLDHLSIKRYDCDMVLEGGSICVDGCGTLLTTEQCLLNANRNPNLDKRDIEEMLALYLGARRVIWLGDGFEQDETDGHVDMIACFSKPGQVLVNMPDDPSDPNYAVMQDNLERLRAAKDSRGQSLDIVEVPQPPREQREDGIRLPHSYINFYIANGGLVVPGFDVPQDGVVVDLLQNVFPGREIVMVPGREIARGGGVIHCITQQQPAPAAEAVAKSEGA